MSSVRNVRLVDAQRECDLSGDPYSAKRPFAQAIAPLLARCSSRVAEKLRLALRTVESWANPCDPQRAPNQTLALAIDAALEAGVPREAALAPLFHLCERYGGDFAPRLPAVKSEDLLAQADRLAAMSLSSHGEAVSGFLEACLDNRLSEVERAKNRARFRRNLQTTFSMMDLNNNAGRG